MTWAALAVGLLLAAFGAMAGAALLATSRAELTRAVASRLRGAPSSVEWLSQVDRHLAAASATTSLGVLLIGAALPAVIAAAGAVRSAVLVALLIVPFVAFTGYLAPRRLTQRRAETAAEWILPILRPWSALLGFVLPARSAARPADLRSVWREGAALAPDPGDEFQLVSGVMTFTQRPVREVMTPRTDLVAVPEDAALEDIKQVFAQSGYSRIPVYRGTLDEIIGMLHAFDLFKLHPGDPLPIRPVAVAPASRTCGDLLLDMQRERRHLAVILDEFGGTLGIATLEDLLEELVGEIFDEHDEEVQAAATAAPTVLELDGSVAPSAVEERFGVTLPATRSATIGGLLAELAGRIPTAGERFVLQGLEFDVITASPTRVERLLVRAGPAPAIPLSAPHA